VTLAQGWGRRDFGAVRRYPGSGTGLRTAETDDVQRAQGSQCRQSRQQPRIELAVGQPDLGGASDVGTVVVQQLCAGDPAVSDVRRELPARRAEAASPDPPKALTIRAASFP